jgi:hypothetical protein
MSISTLSVSFPRGFAHADSIEVPVFPDLTVAEVLSVAIRTRYPENTPDPKEFGIWIKPFDQFLYPACRISQFRQSLSADGALLVRSKTLRTVRILFIRNLLVTQCDVGQSNESLIYEAVHQFPSHPAFEDWTHFSLAYKGKRLPNDDPVSKLFELDPNIPVPTVVIRREWPSDVTVTPETSIYNTSLVEALAKCNSTTIPYFIETLMRHVATKIDQVGIYRKSGLQTQVDAIADYIDKYTDPAELDQFLDRQAGHDMACALKMYFRTIVEPFIPTVFNEDCKLVALQQLPIQQARLLKLCVGSLPTPTYDFFRAFLEHIEFVLTGPNEMSPNAVAICLGQNFFRSLPDADIITDTSRFQAAIKRLIECWRYVFLSEPITPEDTYVRATADTNVRGTAVKKGQLFAVAENGEAGLKILLNGMKNPVEAGAFEDAPMSAPPPFDQWVVSGGQGDAAAGVKYMEPEAAEVTCEGLSEAVARDIEAVRGLKKELAGVVATLNERPDDQAGLAALKGIQGRLAKL